MVTFGLDELFRGRGRANTAVEVLFVPSPLDAEPPPCELLRRLVDQRLITFRAGWSTKPASDHLTDCHRSSLALAVDLLRLDWAHGWKMVTATAEPSARSAPDAVAAVAAGMAVTLRAADPVMPDVPLVKVNLPIGPHSWLEFGPWAIDVTSMSERPVLLLERLWYRRMIGAVSAKETPVEEMHRVLAESLR